MSQITNFGDGGAVGGIITITGDIGGAISPDGAGNITITGGEYLTVTGTGGANSLEIELDSNAAVTAVAGWNGSIIESPVVDVASDGSIITFSVERSGTGDLTVVFSDGFYDWDTTPAATIALTEGSDTAPQINYVYFLQSTKTLTVSTVGWPAAEHAPLATVLCQSAASLQPDGSYKVHAWTDHVISSNNSGHIGHLNYWIRYQNATWQSGVSQTLNITTNVGTPDNVIFTNASGTVLQLHNHTFPAFSGTPDVYVVNDSTTSYDKITDLNTLLTDASGISLSGRYFSLVMWGVVSEDGSDCKLMINLPESSYGTAARLNRDTSKYADFSIPSDFKGTGFLISQLNLRHQTLSGGTWTEMDLIDLRGLYPSIAAGGATAEGTTFEDNVFRIIDEGDNTKELAFEVSGITTATTRTITMDDRDIDLDSVPDQFTTDSGTAVPAAGIATIAGGDTIVTSGAGSTITIDTTGALKTDTGFEAWTGAGNYFDDTVIGDFQLLRGGSGYINGVPVAFTAPQTVTGLLTGELYWIYIDNTGTLQKTTTRTNTLYNDNIILFQCARDSTTPTNTQITAKENHPFSFPRDVSNYNHYIIGTVIENVEQGANITLNGTQKIQINGSDELADEGLYTIIPDSSSVAELFFQVYTLASGKWAMHSYSDTFDGYYNNAGTPTVLGASKYGIYTLYVGKDSLNVTTPRYVAVLDNSEYSNLSAAQTAIASGNTAIPTGGLKDLEIAQLGYIIYQKSTDTIVDVIIDKATLKQTTSTGGTNVASLVTTSTIDFDGILSAGDSNVQAALETIDEWGKTTTDHAFLIGNGTGVAIGSLAVGATGETVIGSTGADPTWTDSPSFGGTVTAATGMTITANDLDITSGKITMPTTTSADGMITINGIRTLHSYGETTNANIFVGKESGNFTLDTTGYPNGSYNCVGIGHKSLQSLTISGYENVGCGSGTLKTCTTGKLNAALGSNSLRDLTTGEENTAFGYLTLGRLTTGSNNIALGIGDPGYGSAYNYTSSESNNIIFGHMGVASESNVIRIGTHGGGASQQNKAFVAGIYNITPSGGNDGLVITDSDGQLGSTLTPTVTSLTTTGAITAGTGMTIAANDLDVVSGSINLPTTTATDGQITINGNSFLHTYGTRNTFVGDLSGSFNINTTTNSDNVGIGYNTLGSLISHATLSNYNVAIGSGVMSSATLAYKNTVIGYNAGSSITDGSNHTIIGYDAYPSGIGGGNTVIGSEAMHVATSGNNITSIGVYSLNSSSTGQSNVAIGSRCLNNTTTGSYNVGIGHGGTSPYGGGSALTGSDSDNICIQNVGVSGDNNTIRLGTQGTGNGQQDTTFIAGIYNTTPAGGADNVVVIDSNGQLGAQTTLPSANGGRIEWTSVSGTTQAMSVNSGYINTNVALTTLTLPDTAAVGDIIRLTGAGSGGWKIAQNAGDTIHFGSSSTTTGTGGSLASTSTRDTVELVCVVANTDFQVLSSIGTVTVI